jgi:hypothetical protein
MLLKIPSGFSTMGRQFAQLDALRDIQQHAICEMQITSQIAAT